MKTPSQELRNPGERWRHLGTVLKKEKTEESIKDPFPKPWQRSAESDALYGQEQGKGTPDFAADPRELWL